MIRVCILTLSDKGSRGEREDLGAPVIREILGAIEHSVDYIEVLPDEIKVIKEKLIRYSNICDLIVTTGGTGLSPRDVTPEATLEVIDQQVPGMAEAMRAAGMQNTPRAMLSRAVVGVRHNTLIVNLPGNPKAVREGLAAIVEVIPHAIDKIQGDEGDCAI